MLKKFAYGIFAIPLTLGKAVLVLVLVLWPITIPAAIWLSIKYGFKPVMYLSGACAPGLIAAGMDDDEFDDICGIAVIEFFALCFLGSVYSLGSLYSFW